jgi:hypothetical protein
MNTCVELSNVHVLRICLFVTMCIRLHMCVCMRRWIFHRMRLRVSNLCMLRLHMYAYAYA